MESDDLNDLEAPDEEMETLLDEQWYFSSINVKIKTATLLTKEQQKRFDQEIVTLANQCIAKSLKDITGYNYSKVNIQVTEGPIQKRR